MLDLLAQFTGYTIGEGYKILNIVTSYFYRVYGSRASTLSLLYVCSYNIYYKYLNESKCSANSTTQKRAAKFPSLPPLSLPLSLPSLSLSVCVCTGKHLKYHQIRNFIFIQVEYLTLNIFVHNSS